MSIKGIAFSAFETPWLAKILEEAWCVLAEMPWEEHLEVTSENDRIRAARSAGLGGVR